MHILDSLFWKLSLQQCYNIGEQLHNSTKVDTLLEYYVLTLIHIVLLICALVIYLFIFYSSLLQLCALLHSCLNI